VECCVARRSGKKLKISEKSEEGYGEKKREGGE
jgi:hypothetical protein